MTMTVMPAKGDTLSTKQIELIKNWIAQGADVRFLGGQARARG